MQVYICGIFFLSQRIFSKVLSETSAKGYKQDCEQLKHKIITNQLCIRNSVENRDVTKKLHKPCLWLIEPRTFVGIGDSLGW